VCSKTSALTPLFAPLRGPSRLSKPWQTKAPRAKQPAWIALTWIGLVWLRRPHQKTRTARLPTTTRPYLVSSSFVIFCNGELPALSELLKFDRNPTGRILLRKLSDLSRPRAHPTWRDRDERGGRIIRDHPRLPSLPIREEPLVIQG
jgi:hypothetical protein